MADLKKSMQDLFKGELGEDDLLVDCPHCDHPITKSEALEKARSGKKGKSPTPTAEMAAGADEHIGEGGQVEHERAGKGVPGIDPAPGVPIKKAEHVPIGTVVAGSQYVQYTKGNDDEVADLIAKGLMGGGAIVSAPIGMGPANPQKI